MAPGDGTVQLKAEHLVGLLAEARARRRIECHRKHLERRGKPTQPVEHRVVDFDDHIARGDLGIGEDLRVVLDRLTVPAASKRASQSVRVAVHILR